MLEERLVTLISNFRQSQRRVVDLEERIVAYKEEIRALERECGALKSQLDQVGKDRFTLKRYKQERVTMRDELERAMDKLKNLESELNPHD